MGEQVIQVPFRTVDDLAPLKVSTDQPWARVLGLVAERSTKFQRRQYDLVAEDRDGPVAAAAEDPGGDLLAFAVVTDRFPGEA